MMENYLSWNEREVCTWLDSFGMQKYAPQFIENNITGEILPELTLSTLKDCGITSVGDRARILQALKRTFTSMAIPGRTTSKGQENSLRIQTQQLHTINAIRVKDESTNEYQVIEISGLKDAKSIRDKIFYKFKIPPADASSIAIFALDSKSKPGQTKRMLWFLTNRC